MSGVIWRMPATASLLVALGSLSPDFAGALTMVKLAQVTPVAAKQDEPPFRLQRLVLRHPPKPVGPKVVLFNGRNLSDWEGWLGYRDPAKTYRATKETPLGRAGADEVFKVVTEDGKPAIHISGKTWGALVHEGDFGDYHLRLEYKWGKGRWAPRESDYPNNGLLYHSHGEHGAVFGTWMKSVEFEIMEKSVGMILPVASNMWMKTSVGIDRSLPAPHRRFMLGGEQVDIRPFSGVENARDAERPLGEWNTLDLYVLGDRAVHVVNGVPVMVVHDIRTIDGAGQARPLTHGRIQVQSEGAETFFRNIVLEPIRSLPTISAR